MKRLIVPFVLLLVASASLAGDEAAAEDSPDPIEILKKVDAAIKTVNAVSYSAKSTPSGIAVNFVSPAEGSAVLVGWNEAWGMPEKFRVHLETTPPGSEEQVELTGGGDGDMFFLIDHTGKKVYEDVGLNDIYCEDPPALNCWIIGEFGYIFHSEDRGATWNRGEILGDVRMDPIRFGYNKIAMPEGFFRPGTEYELAIGTVSPAGNISFVETSFTLAE